MHGDGERPLYFLCQLVDITERRRAEAERRAAQERMQAIIDNSPALVIVKDLEQRYLLVNRRWEEMLGVRGERGARPHRPPRCSPAARPARTTSTARSSRPASVRESMATMPARRRRGDSRSSS